MQSLLYENKFSYEMFFCGPRFVKLKWLYRLPRNGLSSVAQTNETPAAWGVRPNASVVRGGCIRRPEMQY